MAELTPWIDPNVTKKADTEQKLIRVGEDRNNLLKQIQNMRKNGISDSDPTLADTISRYEGMGQIIATLRNNYNGLDANGQPMRPERSSLIDPATGKLVSQYQIGVDQLTNGQLDPSKMEGYSAYKGEALRSGPSQWAKLMQEQQNIQRMGNMEKASRQAWAGAAQARGQLAMRGGLSSGARERIAQQSAHDLLGARQDIGRAANADNLKLLTDDESNRLKNLQNFTGMESDLGKYNIDQQGKQDIFNIQNKAKVADYNIGKALEEKRAQDIWNMTNYQEQLKKFGAEGQSNAIQNSGGGGGK